VPIEISRRREYQLCYFIVGSVHEFSLGELTVIQVSLRGYLKSIFAVMPAGCLESNRNARAGRGDHHCDAIGYQIVRVRARLNAAEVSVEFSTEPQNLRRVIDTRLELAGASLSLVGRSPQCNETLAEIADWLRATVAAEQELLFDGYVQGLRRCRNLLRTSHGLRRLDSGCRAHRPPCIDRNTRRPRQDCSEWLTTIRMGYGECRTFRLG